MRAEYRCSDVFHGARCVLAKLHTGDHQSEFTEWNARTDKSAKLPSAIKLRKGRANHAESRGFKFYLACRQYNRENGQDGQKPSTASVVAKLPRKELFRLAKLGRVR